MNRVWRLPILVLLVVLVVAAALAEGRRTDDTVGDVRVADLAATAAPAGTLSSTWYCAAGSATGVASGEGAGPAEQRVIVANASDTDSTGVLTLYPEGGAPVTVPVTVAAHTRAEVKVSDHVKAAWAAAMVEVTGGEITVAHELTGPTGRSVSDCASAPGSSWYFPGGTTRVGTRMWLALFNPFPGEATVDVAFDSTDGARTPQEYEGIVVPGGGLVVKEVSAGVTLKDQVSTTVSVRSGRIVAEQVQSLEGRDNGVKGLSATMGATVPSPVWSFPVGAPPGVDAAETVSVFNPGDTDITVQVQVQIDDPATFGTVEPFEVSVPARRLAVVPVVDPSADPGTERVPKGAPHWIIVTSTDGADIVAQRSLTGGGPDGFSTMMGLPVVATRWYAPVATTADTATAQLSVANTTATATATIALRRSGGGTAADVALDVELTVAPGQRLVIDLLAAGFTPDATVEVTSDVPVVVGQWLGFSTPKDVATPLGVPVGGTQSVPVDVVGPTVSDEQLSTDDLSVTETLVNPDEVPPDTADLGSTTTTAGP